MQAKFQWAGLVVEIDTFNKQVMLVMERPEVAIESGDPRREREVVTPAERFVVGLDKPSARSIASALMGAAAEL